MSEAVGGAPRAAKLDLGALWVAPPLIVLALLFLYPLVLIAHAALVDDAGVLNLQAALATLQSRAFGSAPCSTPRRSRSPRPPVASRSASRSH